MAAAISATQARNPITLRAIRVVINRCPIVDTPYRAAPALPDGALRIRSPSSDHLRPIAFVGTGVPSFLAVSRFDHEVGFYHRSEELCVTAICPAMSALGQKRFCLP